MKVMIEKLIAFIGRLRSTALKRYLINIRNTDDKFWFEYWNALLLIEETVKFPTHASVRYSCAKAFMRELMMNGTSLPSFFC